ncbi:methyltransferase [Mycobacterium sp. 1245499.0]|uniref:FkbM family methyltransferase n=1 Tax=Mycobacterium sp. 1245499.0 TaxID=1834074 RepID=UPI0007FED2A6|nr:FkbM family methyltransferase [Mycobacterium sp. 1245499.0]OBL08221.1 methyltransferase [Mycobacterium sp. 1245499.0]
MKIGKYTIDLSINRYFLPGALSPWHWRGMQIDIEPKSAIAHTIRRTGGFEEAEIEIAAALYAVRYSGRHIVDVGANIGLHSLAWSKLAPVLSVEPAPATYARLTANVAANQLHDRIRTVRTAVSDTVGEVEFFVAKDSAFSSMKDTRRREIADRVVVPCTTLDKLAAELPPVGLVKIDVEGFERAVIAGAAGLLRRDQPVLFVEIYGGTDSNPDPEGTVEDIRSYGYDPFVYVRDVGLLPYERHRDDRQNYFFIPAR